MTDDWKGRGVALFDMDGTLLPWDTQYVFSCFVVRLHPWRRLLIVLFLACIPFYVLKIWDERRMKRAYLMYLWGLPAETVREYGRKFAKTAQEWIYPELKERLEEDRKKGYLCLMVSASPSFYVKPLGELLGFDGVLGTDVLLEKRMPAMPELPHGNNKGAVKVKRLRERNVLPEHGILENAVAYSDSAADMPMLLSCRRKVLVNPSPALKKDRRLDGAECLYPARPWKGRLGKIWKIVFFVMGLVNVNDRKSMIG